MGRAGLMLAAGIAVSGFSGLMGLALPAAAQTVPEGQSCGGLLCDIGVFGHKTAPAAAPVPPSQPAAAEAEPPARKPRHAEAKRAEARRVQAKTVQAKPLQAKPAGSDRADARPAAPGPAAATPVAAASPVAPPAAPEIFVPMTPYASPRPSPVTLTPIAPN